MTKRKAPPTKTLSGDPMPPEPDEIVAEETPYEALASASE